MNDDPIVELIEDFGAVLVLCVLFGFLYVIGVTT